MISISNKIRWFLFFILLFPKIYSQKYIYSKDELDRMELTYTYYVIQKISLEVIAIKYPTLEKQAHIAANEWIREYLPSIDNIDNKLKDTLKAEWEKRRSFIQYKYSGTDYSTISEEDAKNYVQEVFYRSVGKMQSPIIETLLIFKPGYLENPEKEYTDGYVSTFSTENLKNPIGIDIKFFHPKSWKPSSGDAKTGLLQSFTSQYGLGQLSMSFYAIKSKNDYTPPTIEQLISEENLKKSLTKNDEIISFALKLKIDNCPASSITYWSETKRNNELTYKLIETFHSYYKNFHLIITFSTNSTTGNTKEIIQRYQLEQKLIRRVVNSIVILSQWEKKRF